MFQWAQSTFDKLSQTVAPPPEEGPGRFAYCVQRGEEDAAMGCIAAMDPVYTVVNQSKGQYPIHLACQYSCQRLIQLLLTQPGINIEQTDMQGNTPLHYASMSTAPNGLDVVKLLITSYGASVLTKNAQGQTPYDVATMNSIRQHLLPIQLQAETQIALDNGGQGLPPGIDMGGLRISNPAMPPPPTFSGGGAAAGPPSTPGTGGPASVGMPPMAAISSPAPPNVPEPHLFGTPTPEHRNASAPVGAAPAGTLTPAPSSRGRSHEYSRVGSSSAAISTAGKYRPDGFHSSSSDVSLQKKYGHVSAYSGRTIAPPPSSGNSSVGVAVAANGNGSSSLAASPAPTGPNPFAAGAGGGRARYGALNSRRYVTYGQVAEPASASPAPAYGSFAPIATAPVPAANFSMFTPGGAAVASQPYGNASAQATQSAPTSSTYGTSLVAPAPASGTPTTPFMPPPPYQAHNYSSSEAPAPYATQQNSANMAESNAQDIFSAPSPHKASSQQQDWKTAEAEPAPSGETALNSQPTEAPAPAPATETLADNWVETVDPNSGQTYYYNAVTNETSWEKPGSDLPAATPLPENWIETVDPSSGRAYYYNALTNETSWERPTVASSTAVTSESAFMACASTLPEVAAPAPTSADAFGSPAPAADPSQAPAPSPVCTTDAVSALPPFAEVEPPCHSATDAFGSPNLLATTTTRSPFHAPPKRSISADELFAEDAPKYSGDENDATQISSQVQAPTLDTVEITTTAEENSAGSSNTNGTAENLFGAPPRAIAEATEKPVEVVPPLPEQSQGELDEDGMMDDVPLSPTLQRPVTEATPTAAAAATTNEVPNLISTPPRAASPPAIGNEADSLFAAIGMPPPPFSARKR